jgi:hypothetical protein
VEFGGGVPQPCLTIRIVRARLDVALFVFDDECAVSQVRPAVVEDDRRERWTGPGRRRDAGDPLHDAPHPLKTGAVISPEAGARHDCRLEDRYVDTVGARRCNSCA